MLGYLERAKWKISITNNPHAIIEYLCARDENPREIKWNFYKFLVKDGNVQAYFPSTVSPCPNLPVFFLLGRHDFNTPSSLAADYLDRLTSPTKAAIWFEESAHFPFWEEPGKFREALIRIDGIIERWRDDR